MYTTRDRSDAKFEEVCTVIRSSRPTREKQTKKTEDTHFAILFCSIIIILFKKKKRKESTRRFG